MNRFQAASRLLVLTLWAGFFTWLIASDELLRYLGPRTYWVAWFGMIALWAVTLLALRSFLRSDGTEEAGGWRRLAGTAVMLVPLAVVLAVPKPSLGSLAASRKLGGGFSSSALAAPPVDDGQLDFIDVAYAATSPKYAANIGLTEGSPVSLVGFVSRSDLPEGTGLRLTRFSIYCCAADVVPFSIDIHTAEPPSFPKDQWLQVEGRVAVQDGSYVVEAVSMEEVSEPSDPYI